MADVRALIDSGTGVVKNVILVGEDYECPYGCLLIDPKGERVSPGDTWDGEKFIPKPIPEPPKEPDLSGFYNDLIAELGFGRANEMQRDFPAVFLTLERENWTLARQGFDYALSVDGITQQEYDIIMSLLDQHYIPNPNEGVD